MYEVKIFDGPNDDQGTLIHAPDARDIKLESGVIQTQINALDSFTTRFYMNNPAYGRMSPLRTLIKVRNTLSNEYEFEGRVLNPTDEMDSSGLHSMAYECEGELGYLHDSVQRHLEFRGTPRELFETILAYHNNQLESEPHKHFELGEMNVTNSTNYMYVYLSAEETTFEAIMDKLIDRLGGELQIRKENGVRYLDYLNRIGQDRTTEIKLSRNLKSISRDINPTEIVTRLTPLGTRIESEDEEATDASEARLTIENVNNGRPYIDRPDLIEEFGIIGKSMTWDDITTENALLSAGLNWINNQKITLNQYKVSAVDLSLIGLDIHTFKKGDGYPTINPIMRINEILRVVGTSKDIVTPQDGDLTIGDKFKNLYEYEHDNRQSARAVQELQGRLDTQSRRVIQLRTAYENISQQVGQIQEDLITIDMDNLPIELQGIHDQLEDIADAIAALPTYGLATPSEHGLMASGDKAKLDRIEVDSMVDLDEIVSELENLNQRLETLELPEDPEGAE